MLARPLSDEALVRRMLPSQNADRSDRSRAWAEWQMMLGEPAVLKFIRMSNNTAEPDEDILQDAMLTAYLEVERGRYTPQPGVPFTAYVKGIARNKLREARRRERRYVPLDEAAPLAADPLPRQMEATLEQREQSAAESAALHSSLAQLPTQRRQVLEHWMHGRSTAEIAARLEISEELVRQHKCRGLRRLRQTCVNA